VACSPETNGPHDGVHRTTSSAVAVSSLRERLSHRWRIGAIEPAPGDLLDSGRASGPSCWVRVGAIVDPEATPGAGIRLLFIRYSSVTQLRRTVNGSNNLSDELEREANVPVAVHLQ
jgi:hypothetical protein